MNFSVEFQDKTSSFRDDDTFEFLDGGVLKVSFTDAGVIHQTHYHAPGVWQTVVENEPSRGLNQNVRDAVSRFLQREWRMWPFSRD